MTAQNPNTWEKLYNGIATNEKNQPGGEEVLKKLDELHAMAQHGSTEDFQKHVNDLLHTYGANYGLSEDTNGQDILREALAWRDTSFPTNELTKQEQAPQQPSPTSSIMSGLTKSFGEHKETPIAGKLGDITPTLHNLQEEELLKEFDDAVARGSEEEINNLLHESLELGGKNGLLNRQLKTSLASLQELTPGQIEMYGVDRDDIKKRLEAQALKQQDALKNEEEFVPKTPSEIEAYRKRKLLEEQAKVRETQLRENINKATDAEKKRAAYQDLVKHKLAQQYAYPSIYEEMYQDDMDGRLLALQQVMAARIGIMQRKRQEQAEEEDSRNHAAAGTYTDTGKFIPQSHQGQGNGFQNLLNQAGGQGINPFSRQGLQKLLSKEGLAGLRRGLGAAGKEAAKKGVGLLAKALFTTPPYIGEWIVGIIVLLILIVGVVVIIVLIIQQQQNNGKPIPIPGLTMNLATNPPDQTHYVNGKDIAYVIDVTYSGTSSIVITDKEPNNANVVEKNITGKYSLGNNSIIWNLDANTPLPDSTITTKHYRFNLTFSQVGSDLVFHNEVVANFAPGSGPQNSSQNIQTRNLNSANNQASGYCSANNLAKYFGSLEAGRIASCICKYESGGDPGVVNKACTSGRTADWSVGLFQINLDTNPQRCGGAFSQTGLTCRVADSATLNRCTRSLMDPTNNISAAVRIYQAGHGWDSGWHAEKGKCF